MILSMTGFGFAEKEFSDKKIAVTVRSVNSKSFDLNMRLPSSFLTKEMEVRKTLSKKIIRGKVSVNISFSSSNLGDERVINKDVVNKYIDDLAGILSRENNDKNRLQYLDIAMKLPGVMDSKVEEIESDFWSDISDVLDDAVNNFTAFRNQEGVILERDFVFRISNILSLLQEIGTYECDRIDRIRAKLSSSLENENIKKIDNNRFEQEMIYYLEKLDITEEKTRLKAHCDYFISQMKTPDSNGKKLAFICQEIGREINTLGSKANHTQMQHIVIKMKDELEKIKEQMLNVL